ncbi:MAG: hypothetical protein KDE32_05385 [Novosphingobium sp.]|nr:hypothetical protein [Novosphingobium sp.]
MSKGRLIGRGGAMLAVLALAATGFATHLWAKSESQSPILAKTGQRDREATAMRIYKTPELQAQLKIAKSQFAASPLASNADATATIDRASEALALSAAYYAANADAARPFIFWGTNAAHSWMGLDVPSSGYGLDSPDNIYRSATIDGSGKYVVRGTVHDHAPAQETFVVYRGLPGVPGSMNSEGHMDELAGISTDTMVTDAKGNFTFTIDADPADGRVNHMQVPRELKGMMVTIRDSLADWSKELPYELTIERVDKPDPMPAPQSEQALVDKAVNALNMTVPFWLNWFENYVYKKPLNDVPTPWKRVQGWGMTQQGRFSLQAGEAWVITLDPRGARFFDFQISDPWTKAVEYVEKTGSFNGSQVAENPDGTITLVASPVDPGVYNWLDTMGLHVGTYQVRWQGLPASVTSGDGAVRKVEIVKLADLAAHLPQGMRMVDAKGRADQLAERRKTYANRLR